MRRATTLLDRLVPALLMAISVALLSAGLLSYAPSTFGDWQTPEPSIGGGDPLFSAAPPPSGAPLTPDSSTSPSASASASPSGASPSASLSPGESLFPTPTLDPGASKPPESASPTPLDITPTPTPRPTDGTASDPPATARPSATPDQRRGIATRISIPALNIDLTVVPGDLIVPGNRDFYPLCDVAMFMREYVQPGEPGSTYIYAHAQRGMFLPLLRASQNNNGASLIGTLIEVYTSDNRLHLYEIFLVKRHATDLSLTNVPAGVHQLVLQTSEGASGTVAKLQVAARPLSVVPASPSEANPQARPRVCLP